MVSDNTRVNAFKVIENLILIDFNAPNDGNCNAHTIVYKQINLLIDASVID